MTTVSCRVYPTLAVKGLIAERINTKSVLFLKFIVVSNINKQILFFIRINQSPIQLMSALRYQFITQSNVRKLLHNSIYLLVANNTSGFKVVPLSSSKIKNEIFFTFSFSTIHFRFICFFKKIFCALIHGEVYIEETFVFLLKMRSYYVLRNLMMWSRSIFIICSKHAILLCVKLFFRLINNHHDVSVNMYTVKKKLLI